MNATTLRIVVVVFLLAHGWVHMSLAQVPVPEPGALRTPYLPAWWRPAVDKAWPVSRLGLPAEAIRMLGWVLWLAVVILYSLSGISLLFLPGVSVLWQGLAVSASGLSLLLLGLYWHPWLPIGILIDMVIIAAVLLRFQVLTWVK